MTTTSQPREARRACRGYTCTPSDSTAVGNSVCGPITRTSGVPERRQAMDQRSRHARMQDVADDRHRQPAEVLFVVADGEQVEQALRRVAVAAVAGVDDVDVGAAGRAKDAGRSDAARRSARDER